VRLGPGERREICTRIDCDGVERGEPARAYAVACTRVESELSSMRLRRATLRTPNEQFNAWLERSAADLALLTAGNPETGYPYAGVPWYSVPFGRDGILTALLYL